MDPMPVQVTDVKRDAVQDSESSGSELSMPKQNNQIELSSDEDDSSLDEDESSGSELSHHIIKKANYQMASQFEKQMEYLRE